MCDRILAFVLVMLRDLQLDFGQCGEVGVGDCGRRLPVGFFQVQRLGLRRKPVEIRSHQLAARVFESQQDEVGWTELRDLWQRENFVRTVCRRIQRGLLRELLGQIQVENLGRQLEPSRRAGSPR
jgi:hypothetical protein